MKKEFLNMLACPVCNKSLKKTGNVLTCSKKHSFKISKSVPIMSDLDPYLETEAKAWEDEWQKGVSKNALKAYKINMRTFKKLKFWEESGEAAGFIPSDKNFTVLDLACGNGVSTANIKGNNVVGLDLSTTQMVRAKSKFKHTNYVMGDAEKLPFKDNTFDLIVAINMLHHVYHPNRVLKEAFRVLKNNGKILTVDPNLHNPIGFTGRGLYRLLRLKKIFPTFPQFALGEDEKQYTKDEYYKLFKKSPFKEYIIKPHRIERILFFSTILVPSLVNIPGYEKILMVISKFGNNIVQIKPFDRLCYFWLGEATK
ncbi:methyltransferase domain-containing protein [Candidatus Microgenomates bacterium]|nr:methyltransferase domain-containing protein [Candidatus Microgenomates bacterium]